MIFEGSCDIDSNNGCVFNQINNFRYLIKIRYLKNKPTNKNVLPPDR